MTNQLSAAEAKRLVAEAKKAREQAYTPYSHFQVGAALLLPDGSVVRGCNVENVSYGLCICAERVAVVTAVASGHREFSALGVITASSPPAAPCGMCRQMLAEFASDLPIVLANMQGEVEQINLRDLLPHAFSARDLV